LPERFLRLALFSILQLQLERAHDVGKLRLGDLVEIASQLREEFFEQRPGRIVGRH
jgi:hypothetical protein